MSKVPPARVMVLVTVPPVPVVTMSPPTVKVPPLRISEPLTVPAEVRAARVTPPVTVVAPPFTVTMPVAVPPVAAVSLATVSEVIPTVVAVPAMFRLPAIVPPVTFVVAIVTAPNVALLVRLAALPILTVAVWVWAPVPPARVPILSVVTDRVPLSKLKVEPQLPVALEAEVFIRSTLEKRRSAVCPVTSKVLVNVAEVENEPTPIFRDAALVPS